MRIAIASLLLLLPAAQDKPVEFTNDEHGFRSSRPGDGWTAIPASPPPGARYALRIARADAKLEFSVMVYVAERGTAGDLDAFVAATEAAHKARPGCGNVSRGKSTLAGKPAPAITLDYELSGATYRLAQIFLLDGDRVFIVQTAAIPKEERAPLDAIVKTFALMPTGPAARCGSEIAWARDWDDAAGRARKEKKLILVIFELYAGFKVNRFAHVSLLTEPDVLALAQERLVCLRWNYGMRGAIQDPDVYGFGGSAFGRALVFFTPDGKAVGDTWHFDPVFFDQYARRVLSENRDFKGAPVGEKDRVATLLRRGDLDEASELLKKPETARDFLHVAMLQRRLRKGDEALTSLDEAEKRDDGTLASDLNAERGLVLARQGKSLDATVCYERVRGAREPEAQYYLGLLRADKRTWEKLVAKHPDNRWAWKAAAAIDLFDKRLWMEKLPWVDEGMYRLAGDARTSPVDTVKKAEDDGVAYLLKTQRANGSWPVPGEVEHATASFIVATTSICGSSLIRFDRKDEVRRALDYVLRTELETSSATAFSYQVWGHCFALRFLAECASAGIGDRAKTVRAMNAHIDALDEMQSRAGGWGYVNLQEVGGAKDPSMGFVTAAILLALIDAKKAGARVPDKIFEGAAGCIASMKGPDGSFSYGGGAGAPNAESSLRSPLYALALKRAGAPDAVRASLDHYIKFRLHVRKERGKTLCHTGPEGTASYYLLYGYRFAAEAAQGDANADVRRALVEDVLATRCDDGGFLDSPVEGRTYGTGMALIALGFAGR